MTVYDHNDTGDAMSPITSLHGALDDEELSIIEGSKNAALSSEKCRKLPRMERS